MPHPHVVVVLNWHGRSDTLACVASLLESDPEISVLVVDNGSFDGTIEELRGVDRVRTLQLARNHGFAGGMNRGLESALEADAAMITILNNDTLVPSGALGELAALARDSVAVSPTIMYRDQPDRVWFAGGTLDMPDAYPHHSSPEELEACDQGARSTTLLAGCCITASAATWRTVGLFDERFFLNFEDSEWSVRARRRGVELLVACEITILHAVSASFRGSAATLGGFYFQRNGLLFSKLIGADLPARVRFVRRFGLGRFRSLTWKERRRRLVVTAWAVGCYATRRFGEAPRGLSRRAARWSGQSTV